MITSNSFSAAEKSAPLSTSLHPTSLAVETEWSDNAHKTSFGVAQHQLNLFSRHPGEPLQELVDPGAIFEILEQRAHGHAAVFK
jgi:hypothetical protein